MFYIRTQPQSTHSLFRDGFTKASGVYKRLGQFDYGQPSCTTYYVYTCIHKDKYDEWIYIGEVKEGTDDTPHGIGIQVIWSSGDIREGYWKDGELDGRGRVIFNSGNYYIGELEGGNYNGKGTYYWPNGDKYEGGWKDSSKYGQGTYYTTDGDKYTGIWVNSCDGQGEINYKDGN